MNETHATPTTEATGAGYRQSRAGRCSHRLDYYGGLIQERGGHAAYLLADECRKADAEARVLKEALRSIIVRCREGDSRSDWLPTIARIAEEALGENVGNEARL